MPYYRERVVSQGSPTLVSRGAQSSLAGFHVREASEMMSYRSKRKTFPGYNSVEFVPDNVAEPYSYFETLTQLKRDGLEARSPTMASGVKPDTGHSWSLTQYKWEGPEVHWHFSDGTYHWDYAGPPLHAVNGNWSPWPSPGMTNIAEEGTNLFARAVPAPDMFNLAQFIGQFNERLPRLSLNILEKTKFFKSLGDDYLNVVFGWKPLLDDLQNLAKAMMAAQSALTGELQVIRRDRKGKDVSSQGGTLGVANGPMGAYPSLVPGAFQDIVPNGTSQGQVWPSFYYSATGTHLETTSTSYSTWFSGSFYIVPKLTYNPENYWERLGALLDTNITPALLWELAPWSWLSDWFLNIGSTLATYESAVNNRVLAQYAYVMEESSVTTRRVTSSFQANYGFLTAQTLPGGYSDFTVRTRRRQRANPFGFIGTTQKPLNGGQWAILGALGLTKIP